MWHEWRLTQIHVFARIADPTLTQSSEDVKSKGCQAVSKKRMVITLMGNIHISIVGLRSTVQTRCGTSCSRCCRRIRKGTRAAAAGASMIELGRGHRLCVADRLCVGRVAGVVPDLPGHRAPPVYRMGGSRRHAGTAPGDAGRSRCGWPDRLVEGECGRDECPGSQRGNLTGRSPVDRGKPGSKIHAVSDRNGLPLTVLVSAANVNDHTVLEDVLDNLRAIRQPLGRPPLVAGQAARRQGLRLPVLP